MGGGEAPNIPFPPLELSLACRAGLPLPCWPLSPTPNRRVTQPQATARTTRAHRRRTAHAQATTRLRLRRCSLSPLPVPAGWCGPRFETVPEKAGPRGAGRGNGSSVGTRGVCGCAARPWHTHSPQVGGIFRAAGYILGIIPARCVQPFKNNCLQSPCFQVNYRIYLKDLFVTLSFGNLNLKGLSNTISIAFNRVSIQKIHFGY